MAQIAIYKAFAEQAAALTHPSAAGDELTAFRHRSFIASHLATGVIPFAALPAVIALGGGSWPALAVFAWLTAPILIALDLSRAGDLKRAGVTSAIAFGALTVLVALCGGGIAWLATPWLALPIVEAALNGSRRGAISAWLVAGIVAAGLVVAGLSGHAALEASPIVAAVGSLVAGVYGASLAIRAAMMARIAMKPASADRDAAALIAEAADDMVTRHAANGATVFASPAASALIGASPRELLDQGLFARVHIGDRPAFLRTLGVVADGRQPAQLELRLRRSSEKARIEQFVWVEMRARRSAVDGAVICVFRDVTDRKAREDELVTAREEAERANLAKTRLLASMSHDLRTPLNAIIGFSEVLSDEALCSLTPERRADYAALIHKSGAHLLQVVNTLIDTANIESGAASGQSASSHVEDGVKADDPNLADRRVARPVFDRPVQSEVRQSA